MSDETVIPCIRTRKRRLVPPDKRKKASFSCDRCKIRKIACHRPSSADDCYACKKANVVCDTTIKRKKKIRGPIENIGLHYKCLLVLVKNLFPNVDANNIDALIDLGERRGFSMPSRYGGHDVNDVKDISLLISTGKAPNSSSLRASSYDESDPVKQEDKDDVAPPIMAHSHSTKIPTNSSNSSNSSSASANAPPSRPPRQHDLCYFFKSLGALAPKQDYIIIDLAGNSHCVGHMGAPGMLDSYLRTIERFPNMDHLTYSKFHSIACGEIVISSSHEPTHIKNLSLLLHRNFPYFVDISYQDAQSYVNVFFRLLHPRIPCFNETSFRECHERFWAATASNSRDSFLKNDLICCIYLVWTLGRLFTSASVDDVSEPHAMDDYIEIVKLCFSEMVLMPTLDGVRCMMLLAVYMDNNKRRESAYVLLELASRQAISLGLSRASLSLCIPNKDRGEEMKLVWWTLYMMEVSMSTQMGRSSCFQMEDIDVEYPACEGICEDANYSEEFVVLMDLSKCLHDVLNYRLLIHHTDDLMVEGNLDRALRIATALSKTFNEAPPAVLNIAGVFTDSKLHLHMRYHYYRIVLTLPYLMQVARSGEGKGNKKVKSLVSVCLWSCVGIAELAAMAHFNASLNGTVTTDVFYLYHAVMGLVVGYCMGGNVQLSMIVEEDVGIQTLEKALEKVGLLQLSASGICRGTLSKISKYIDAFTYGFDQLRSQVNQRPVEGGEGMAPQATCSTETPVVPPDAHEFIAATRTKVNEVELPGESKFQMDDLLSLPLRYNFGDLNLSHVEYPIMYDDMGLS